MQYRSEIDGLRALAVLPVILFHAGYELFSGGFVGVDVFFVISGYLITTIILSELASDKFSIVNFYERRARRILPALFVVIAACIPFAWVWLDPFALKEFFQSMLATSVFSSNIYFYLKTGYFDVSAELKPLLHTWSLAVEEQYYVLIPLLMIGLWKVNKKLIGAAFILILLLSLAAAEYFVRIDGSFNFYLLPTRAWELMLGSLVAVFAHRIPLQSDSKRMVFLSSFGLGLILYAVFAFDETTPFPSLYTLIPTLGVVFILCSSSKTNIVNRLLSHKILVSIGLVSYSAYLWHQPILAFYRTITFNEPTWWVGVLVTLSTLALASLTYHFVEQPFRNKNSAVWTKRNIFLFSGFGIVLFASIGVAGHQQKGFPERNEQFLRIEQNIGLSSECSGASFIEESCKTSDDPSYLLWGDSHAMHLAQGLQIAAEEQGVWQLTLSACSPVLGLLDAPRKALISCKDFNEGVLEHVNKLSKHSERTLILSSSVSLADVAMRQKFKKTMSRLNRSQMQVVLVSSTPHFPKVEECIIKSLRGNGPLSACQYRLEDAKNFESFENERQLAAQYGIQYISLVPLFCNVQQQCSIEQNGVLLLRDASHLTTEAKDKVADLLRAELDIQ